jgi:hypothetical protein
MEPFSGNVPSSMEESSTGFLLVKKKPINKEVGSPTKLHFFLCR